MSPSRVPRAGAAPVLEARSLSVERGGRRVLRGVDLEVSGGQLVVVVGPNGAGKSTLIAALAGDLGAAEGDVRLLGRPPAEVAPAVLARERAVVRQGSRAPAGASVLDVVRLGRLPHGDLDAPAGEAVARRALEVVGLHDLAGERVEHLSGGQVQGVHLARAVAQLGAPTPDGPPARGALLLDEPTTALDLARQIAFLDLARTLAERGLAVVAVLHDLALAARSADRLLVLASGRVEAEGRPAEVLTPPLLARVFGVRATVVPAPWCPDRPWIGVEGAAPSDVGPAPRENVSR